LSDLRRRFSVALLHFKKMPGLRSGHFSFAVHHIVQSRQCALSMLRLGADFRLIAFFVCDPIWSTLEARFYRLSNMAIP